MPADALSADARLASYIAAQTKAHYDGALAQQTSFTWVQKTTGAGYAVANLVFDVRFSAEPVFTSGAALVSITSADYMPLPTAVVMVWKRDPKNGLFLGASVVLSVELRFVPGFVLKNRTAPVGDAKPVPTVAHHLTFSGPSITSTPKAKAKGTPKKTGMTP